MLGELCTFQAGSAFPLQYQGNSSGDYPFIKVSDMKLDTNRYKIHDANNWIDADVLVKLNAKTVPQAP